MRAAPAATAAVRRDCACCPAKSCARRRHRRKRAGRMLPGCGHAPLEQRALARLHAAGQPDGAGRRACRGSNPGFRPICCTARSCELVQLGLAVDPVIIFPPEYPYTSGTTKLLRDNFADLYARGFRAARARAGGPRHRHRLERRHAAVEFQDRRPPGARHRADRRRQDRQRARHSDAAALLRRRPSQPRSGASTARRASSRRRTALRISRMCTRSSTAFCDLLAPTACSFPNRIISSG